MLFHSIEFLLFFPLVVGLYFLFPFRWRWLILLLASYAFYMSWRAEYIILILASTTIDYFAAIQIYRAQDARRRRNFLLLSLTVNLGLLFSFKYLNFFNASVGDLLAWFHIHYRPPLIDILLPVGISFYTFQTLSYTIDVYRGKQQPETHFGKFALFVSFFPQLVAGPIERSTRLLPQFSRKNSLHLPRINSGLRLMAWGFFKKLVIADRLAPIVDTVYSNPYDFSGIPLLLATFFFSVQIYCDFSGYSDIAIGAARVLGYDLMENFRQPYFSRSVREFWGRWHISLSTWFRDYVYIPLGGNRVMQWRWYFNLFVVFVISGLWHGANWTFVLWGALHGIYIVAQISTRNARRKLLIATKLNRFPRLLGALSIMVTFGFVLVAWIFFRANSLADAIYIVRHLAVGLEFSSAYGLNIGGPYEMAVIVLALATLLIVDAYEALGHPGEQLIRRSTPLRWSLYYALLFSILIFGKFGVTEFIYFQF